MGDERTPGRIVRSLPSIILLLLLITGASMAIDIPGSRSPEAKTCTIYINPSPRIADADLPVMVGEVAFLFLKVKDTSPSPDADVRFFLTSPSGNVTQAKGLPFSRSFRGQSPQIGEKGMWNVMGSWSSGAESCQASKIAYMGSDSFTSSSARFDTLSRRLVNTFSVTEYGSDSGNIDMLLLDPSLTQNNSGLTLSLGSVFATVTMDYDAYVVPGQRYPIRASFYNNYLTEVNATLTVRLTTQVKVPVSSSPPVTAEYRPDLLRLDANVTIPSIGMQTAWLNFSLSSSHSLAAGGWFPVRAGVFSMTYTLSSSMDKNTSTTTRPVRVLPEGAESGRPVSMVNVKAASFTGIIMGTDVPPSLNSPVMMTLATSIRGVSVHSSRKVYLTMPVPDLKETGRNDTFIKFEARAESKNGMASVEFLNSSDGSNWTRICLDSTQANGWTCAWNTTALQPGKYHVSVVATDDLGMTQTAQIIIEIYGPPGMLESLPFPWWWLGIAAIAGIAIVGTRRLIYAANPLLVKEGEMRGMLVRGELDGFRRSLMESVGILTDRYASVQLRESSDLSSYARALKDKGILTTDIDSILRLSLAWAFGRRIMTRQNGKELYVLYLKYKNYLKIRPKQFENN